MPMVRSNKDGSCLGCTERTQTCHTTCEKYLKQMRDSHEKNAEILKRNQLKYDINSVRESAYNYYVRRGHKKKGAK